jgi:hypothetical protein
LPVRASRLDVNQLLRWGLVLTVVFFIGVAGALLLMKLH